MRVQNGKYFYTVEHPKPSLLDIPPSCKDLLKKNEEIYEYDFKKFQQSTYQRSEYRVKSMIGSNQNSDNYYGTRSRNNDLFQRKKQSYGMNLNGGLNFDYNNLQIDSNYGSTNDQKYGRGHDKSSKDDNFFTNKISMVPPPGDNIFGDRNSKSSSNNYNNNNFNDKRNSNHNRDNSGNSTNYNSNYDKYDLNSKPKRSNVQSYDYQDKTSSRYENVSQTSNMPHQSKQYSSNSHKNFGNPVSNVKHDNINSFATKTNSSSNANRVPTTNISSNINRTSTTNSTAFTSNANRTSTTNSTAFTSNANRTSTTSSTAFTSKINSSSKTSSSNPASLYPNGIESKYSKKKPVYDYSKPIPTGDDYSSQTKSYNSSKTKTTNSSNRNDYNIQNQRSSVRNSSSITTSNNVNSRNNFNLKNQPSSIQSTTTTTSTSSRPQYTSTNSNFTANSVRQSKSSASNQNSRFTTTSDLLNQIPQNYGSTTSQFQSRTQKQTRTSMQQPYYDDIRPPNLTQYNRPQVGNSSAYTNNTTTVPSSTTNSQAQFIAHQAQYSGNKNMPANPPTEMFSKKTAISNPGYDFLQKYGQDQSQSQSFNQGGANNDSFTIDPVPKKTRVEFPEPQTAPKPFQTIDAGLEGEVSQEEAQKVEDLNDLMKSFHADSDSENNLDKNENDKNKSKNTTTFNIDDLKKGLFSSFFEEEEEEAEFENDNQEDNEKNNKPLEDLSVFDDIEQKSKDFDDQNINTFADEEESNKLEIASSEDSPIDSIPPNETKKQNNIQFNPVQINDKDEEEDTKDIQNFVDKIKKSIGNEEEEDENTVDFIKKLEEEDYKTQKQDNKIDINDDDLIEDDQLEEDLFESIQKEKRVDDDVFFEEEDLNAELQNKQQKKNEDIQNEDKTVEDVFLEEEENESMIEKVNADIYLSDDEDNQINMDKVDKENKMNKKDDLDDGFDLNFDNEEEESETDKSIEAILKKANEQHLISDGNYEDEDEEESLLFEDNKTPISHFKKPLKFLAQNITNKYSSNNNGLELAFELADKILKKQLKKILSL